MKLGIIGPTENEIMAFIRCLSDVRIVSSAMLKFYSGNYRNIPITAFSH